MRTLLLAAILACTSVTASFAQSPYGLKATYTTTTYTTTTHPYKRTTVVSTTTTPQAIVPVSAVPVAAVPVASPAGTKFVPAVLSIVPASSSEQTIYWFQPATSSSGKIAGWYEPAYRSAFLEVLYPTGSFPVSDRSTKTQLEVPIQVVGYTPMF